MVIKEHLHHTLLLKKLLQYCFYALIPVLLFRVYYNSCPRSPPNSNSNTPAAVDDSFFFSSPLHKSDDSNNDDHGKEKIKLYLNDSLPPLSISSSSSPPASPPPAGGATITSTQVEEHHQEVVNGSATATSTPKSTTSCDYTDGEWVPTTTPPLYNGTSCSQIIKDNQNCIAHGRPDLSYLYYQWKPTACNLPPFNPSTFLTLLKNKHLAFIGDSMARNQLESLICLLSSSSSPQLIYAYPENDIKFRRWLFPSHNVTISVYWSPFLVKGIEKSSETKYYNTQFLDTPDPNWFKDLAGMDMVVLTIGNWYLHDAVFYENGTRLGCKGCTNTFINCTQIGFYGAYRKSIETALNTIIRNTNNTDVMVTTFMPAHFESEWDKPGACNRSRPYNSGEIEIQGMNAEMRKVVLEQVEQVKSSNRVSVLDITKLSLLRPDGHPGPYMYAFPFADGVVKERIPQDCLHFCLPGPVDTWNQILSLRLTTTG